MLRKILTSEIILKCLTLYNVRFIVRYNFVYIQIEKYALSVICVSVFILIYILHSNI